MQRFFENVRDSIINFKLNLCCFMARVRVGILLFGYYNLISSVVSTIAVATGSFPPLYMHAQQSFMDGEYVKSSATCACAAELCASVLLLSAVYREDVILLKYFTYVGMGMAAASLLVYGMVIGILDMLTTILVFVSLFYQVYLIVLVRSFIIEIKTKKAVKRNSYAAHLRLNDIKTISNDIPKEKYTVVIEPDTSRITPEDSPVLQLRHYMAEPETNETAKRKSETITKDTAITKKEGTANEAAVMSYPFKFVAIKIPKEGTSKEEKNDTVNKEKNAKEGQHKEQTDKDEKAVIKEKTDEEVIKDIIRPPRRSIFGRKKKEKIENNKTDDESKKP